MRQTIEYNKKETDSQIQRTKQSYLWGEGWARQGQRIKKNKLFTKYKIKKQGLTVQHRELYSISCDKP